jgi:hypothetical protein
MSPSAHGFLVMDVSLKLIDANGEAERVLVYVYPEDPKDKIRRQLSHRENPISPLKEASSPKAGFVAELRSGRRRYLCLQFLH